MLLVDHDQAEVGERGEDRRARADAHPRLPRAHAPPLVVALARGELGVHHGHGVAEALHEAARGLRGERDLGHEHDGRAPALEGHRHRAQVDLGLAAAGDPVEQQGRARVAGLEARGHRIQGGASGRAWAPERRRPRRPRRRSAAAGPARGPGGAPPGHGAPGGAGSRGRSPCPGPGPPRRRGPAASARSAACWRAPSRAASSGEMTRPASVSSTRSELRGRSGLPLPVPVPGGSTSASPRAGAEQYSRASQRPRRTSAAGTWASSARRGSARRSGGSSLSSAMPTTTPSSRRRPNGTTSMLPTPTPGRSTPRR